MTEDQPDWYPMWKQLGLDVEKHDQLLAVLPDIFKEIYIDAQKNRPEGMGFFDFVVGDIHGIRVNELQKAKEEGKKIISTFCLYIPDEIIFALDAVGIGLCGGTNFSNYASEDLLPTNICSLIKSSLGFGVGNICPYFALSDLIIGETTCDGKKKCWEIMSKYKPVYVLETPQIKDRNQAKRHYLSELKALIMKLEELTGNILTYENLKAAMEKISTKRAEIKRVYETRKNDPAPISGKDALLVSQVAFYDDPDRQIQMVGKLADELAQRAKNGIGVFKKGTKRIIVSGTPMAIPNWKLHHLVETKKAVIVAEETCTGTRYFTSEYEIKGNSIDELIAILADRYLGINCACFSPNEGRKDDILRLMDEYNADGVILYTLNFCQPYDIEALNLEKALKEKGVPVLSITTDYSSDDEGQLNTRIEAFLEMIK
ncbi:MAG: double-cubane-cluster-containing anaerobic reductase [Promethearchaeota archaeon]|jgi:benzoyl-CoA reductase/2-hydroxyglutaryl-CoA dehydratase subunit BcrC/BadD/HgdB